MRRLAVLTIAIVLVLVLGAAQLFLPGIAAQRLRDRLSRSGTVLHVEVHAFPAIELLWHHADRIVVRMADYQSNPGHLGDLLNEAGDVGSVDASARTLHAGLLTVRDASMRKRGNQLTGTARVSEADLRAAVPFLTDVRPVAAGAGTLTLQGTATALGISATAQGTVAARGGQLIFQPDIPFGDLATVTVFSDPRLTIDDLQAALAPGGFTVSVHAQLR